MNIDISNVGFSTNFNSKYTEEILNNIKVILTTPLGTVPFDREFGIDLTILDMPIEQSKALYTIEAINKVKKYEPRAKINRIYFNYNQKIGVLTPEVVLELA